MPRKPPPRLRQFLPFLALLGGAILWSLYWFVLSTTAKSLHANMASVLAAKGAALSCTDERWGGYPFRIEYVCQSPVLNLRRGNQPIAITSGRLHVLMQAYDYRHFIAFLDGPSEIAPASAPPLPFSHSRLTASLVLRDGRPARLAAETAKIETADIAGADNIVLNAVLQPDGGLDIAAAAKSLQWSAKPELLLDSAAVEVVVPPALATAEDPIRAAAATGAALHVKHVEVSRGTLALTGTGDLGLDPEGRPVGTVTTTVNDLDTLLAEVRKFVPLTDDDANAMRTMLDLLSGGKVNAKIPLKAATGALFWGPFKIADLPSLL